MNPGRSHLADGKGQNTLRINYTQLWRLFVKIWEATVDIDQEFSTIRSK
jgi:hypothetical protein